MFIAVFATTVAIGLGDVPAATTLFSISTMLLLLSAQLLMVKAVYDVVLYLLDVKMKRRSRANQVCRQRQVEPEFQPVSPSSPLAPFAEIQLDHGQVDTFPPSDPLSQQFISVQFSPVVPRDHLTDKLMPTHMGGGRVLSVQGRGGSGVRLVSGEAHQMSRSGGLPPSAGLFSVGARVKTDLSPTGYESVPNTKIRRSFSVGSLSTATMPDMPPDPAAIPAVIPTYRNATVGRKVASPRDGMLVPRTGSKRRSPAPTVSVPSTPRVLYKPSNNVSQQRPRRNTRRAGAANEGGEEKWEVGRAPRTSPRFRSGETPVGGTGMSAVLQWREGGSATPAKISI
eukprot:Hpha_TRINITY_DN16446_c0_g1::TRINITY_DN16446_c0_g1_i2::g.163807::m.163807